MPENREQMQLTKINKIIMQMENITYTYIYNSW